MIRGEILHANEQIKIASENSVPIFDQENIIPQCRRYPTVSE